MKWQDSRIGRDETQMIMLPAIAMTLVLAAATEPLAASPLPPPLAFSAAECEVWKRERSFAQSVADHDHTAFAEHVHPDAAFVPGPTALTRGRDAIAAEWAGLIDGTGVVLRWHPQLVAIGGDPDTAVSQGPYWIEDLRPEAKQRFSMGRFNSVWSRGDDGVWHVMFDGGGAPAQPATAEEIAQLKAGLPKECPRNS
jgi:ketosteroid isomerase-like protein